MSGEGGGCGEGETSEQDESSSSSSNSEKGGMEQLLESFRQQWQRELEPSQQQQQQHPTAKEAKTETSGEDSPEEVRARVLFLQGVALEEDGKLHEAISCYRRAMQLVPDIEFKIYAKSESSRHHTPQHKLVGEREAHSRKHSRERTADEDEDELEDLPSKFQRVLAMEGAFCQPDTLTKMTHVSQLPPELVLLLLRWVVSADVDLRSLESCSEVCRGFYLAARDNEIWRLICARVWGPTRVIVGESTLSWREQFVARPRVHFNGCYISRTTYIRSGEQSFQDSFYRLWHSVQYYRYIRFFPGGLVLMLTSSEEPSVSVGHLRHRTPRNPAVLTGRYKLSGEVVTMELHQPKQSPSSAFPPSSTQTNNRYVRGRRRNQEVTHDSGEKTFLVELQIAPYHNKNNFQLSWLSYCIETKYRAAPCSVCPFELCPSKFPPLWFSRVKSYMGAAEECL